MVGAPTWSLTTGETRHLLVELTRIQAQVTELEARVLTHAEATDAGVETGATSTANWLGHATKTTRPEAHRRIRLATTLAAHPITREAMSLGHVLAEQAGAIITAVDTLPDDVSVRKRCEKHLVALAEHHDAKALRVLGRHVLEVVDPDATTSPPPCARSTTRPSGPTAATPTPRTQTSSARDTTHSPTARHPCGPESGWAGPPGGHNLHHL